MVVYCLFKIFICSDDGDWYDWSIRLHSHPTHPSRGLCSCVERKVAWQLRRIAEQGMVCRLVGELLLSRILIIKALYVS